MIFLKSPLVLIHYLSCNIYLERSRIF